MASEETRTVIASGELPVRDRLVHLIQHVHGLHIVGAWSSLAAAQSDIERDGTGSGVDVAWLGGCLSTDEDAASVRGWSSRFQTPVGAVASSWSYPLVMRAWRAGVRAFLTLDADPPQIRHAMRDLKSGGVVLGGGALASLIQYRVEHGRFLASQWLPSENHRRVLGLVVAGASNRAIALRLGMDLNSVKFVLREVYVRLGVSDRAGALARVRALGILAGDGNVPAARPESPCAVVRNPVGNGDWGDHETPPVLLVQGGAGTLLDRADLAEALGKPPQDVVLTGPSRLEETLGRMSLGKSSAPQAVVVVRVLAPSDVEASGVPLPPMRWENLPAPRHVLVSRDLTPAQVVEALVAGASVVTPCLQDVTRAVRAAHRGESFLGSCLAQEALEFCAESCPSTASSSSALCEQHLEVLRRVATGMANKQIADHLGTNVNTVKLRLKEIFTRLGARDRCHALVVALQTGLLSLEEI